MKFFKLLLCLPILAATAQVKPKSVDYKITEATVFLSGAQLKHEAKVGLDAGTNLLVFEDLPAQLNKNSIQVKGGDNYTILNVKHAHNFLRDKKNSPRITRLTDSLEDLRLKLDMRRGIRMVFEEEKTMILANKEVRGDTRGLNVEDLMDLADFYRDRLKDIEMKLIDVRLEEKKLNEEIARVDKSLKELTGTPRHTSEITVEVVTRSKTTASVELNFIVQQAGWTPSYDIRSNALNTPVELTYKAQVFQSTGSDWENIKLTLSTGNPSINNTQPILYPWILNYYSPQMSDKKRQTAGAMPQYRNEDKEVASAQLEEVPIAPIYKSTLVTQNLVTTEFKIATPYSIPSGNSPGVVEIQKHKLNSNFKYYAVPKLDKDAFLLAEISGWDQYNLLAGNASTYFEGTFVGESFIDPATTQDTLSVSLGRDKGISIDRKRVTELCKQTVMGGNKKHAITIEISVRNSKKEAVNIDLYDQIPLSRVKEIESSLSDAGEAVYNKETGELKWSLKLNPGESKSFRFSYEIKHPKDKVLSNL